jgi:chromosome segregation ATPase
MAAKLERAEATIGTLRGERRELKAGQERLADRLVAAERLLESARAEADRVPEVVTVREQAPDAAEVRAAQAEAGRANRAAAEAELRAARAERELRETVAAIRGEARKLTSAELAELRTHGPGGPAVMAEALKALAAARRSNNPMRMQDALRRIAQAAVTWQERI